MQHPQEFCTECGHALGGAKFCGECGVPAVAVIDGAAVGAETGSAPGNGAVPYGEASGSAPSDGSFFQSPESGFGPKDGSYPQSPEAGYAPHNGAYSQRIDPHAPAGHGGGPVPPGLHGYAPAAGRSQPWGPQGLTPPSPASKKSSTGVVVAVAGGALIVVLVVLAVVLLSSGSGDDSYRRQVASALAPVIAANRQISQELTGLPGTRASASAATRRGQSAVVAAQGALGVLSAPASAGTLQQQSKVAIEAAGNYLQAVGATLANPADASAGQVQTLGANLQNALNPLDTLTGGGAGSVSGAGDLDRWAQSAVAAQKQAEAKKAAKPQGAPHPAVTVTTVAPPAPSAPSAAPSVGTNCGGGLVAGPVTSCAFAQNVESAYHSSGGNGTLDVYSPVTGQYYSMSCSSGSGGVSCTGGNNASVSFP